jgi:starch phosphorylase
VQPWLRQLPEALQGLATLALDLRWTWSHAADRLWQNLAPDVWERTENPWLILLSLSDRRLAELAEDRKFLGQLGDILAAREEYLNGSTWYKERYPEAPLGEIAYFSMEYGLGEALPLYSGGLGILAGDHLKTASDLGLPMTAVGLLYQEGYFRQMVGNDGRQIEIYPYSEPWTLPVTRVHDDDGGPVSIHLELPGRELALRVWQAQVGRVDLFLLDSNDPLNSPADRGITGKLYAGGEEIRLVQEIVLGVGGWRVLRALGREVEICHLNEGHAALATIERARDYMQSEGLGFREALWATRIGNVFTTHTPVAAAFDKYPSELITKYGRTYAEEIDIPGSELLGFGRLDPRDESEPFNLAYLAARTCGRINGVSRLHGEVSRRIFHGLYPRWPESQVPVSHITNGVHVPSWDSPWADAIWTETCGKNRWMGMVDTHAEAIRALDDETIWSMVGGERHDLVRYARERLARQLAQRGESAEVIREAEDVLDPNTLTIGFARRFTEYKRPNLLLRDPERFARLLCNRARPVQIIVAGKAHPEDEIGKDFVSEWAHFVQRPELRNHAVFLEDYDIALAQELVQGVDLWINTPLRPWEACGTSGMKVLANGGLNLSELDGWWAEAYRPDVGWALGDGVEHPPGEWDAREAQALYGLLEQEIVPAFYDRDASGIPRGWVQRMRACMAELAPQFSANRMVQQYVEEVYVPSGASSRRRVYRNAEFARELHSWELSLKHHWPDIHFGSVDSRTEDSVLHYSVQVYLGDLDADMVEVQLYAEPGEDSGEFCKPMNRLAPISGTVNGYVYGLDLDQTRPASDYTARVVPRHDEVSVPQELPLILWQR